MTTIDDEPTVVLESTAQEFYAYLRPAVRAMARRMEDELRQNDHKGDWKDCRSDVLYSLLLVEMDELANAVVEGDPDHIASEAGDVGNYALMIADVMGGLSGDGSILGSRR